MNWIIEIIKKLFKRNNVKLIEASRDDNIIVDTRNDFIIKLKKEADPQMDDGDGYNIQPILNLEEMK